MFLALALLALHMVHRNQIDLRGRASALVGYKNVVSFVGLEVFDGLDALAADAYGLVCEGPRHAAQQLEFTAAQAHSAAVAAESSKLASALAEAKAANAHLLKVNKALDARLNVAAAAASVRAAELETLTAKLAEAERRWEERWRPTGRARWRAWLAWLSSLGRAEPRVETLGSEGSSDLGIAGAS